MQMLRSNINFERSKVSETFEPKLNFTTERLAAKWDEENKDTLRHEAHHMVQDCLVDGRPDFQFPGDRTLFTDPVDFAVQGAGFTERQIQQIYITYAGFGLDEADILIEVEAWAVAASVDAAAIAHSLDHFCK